MADQIGLARGAESCFTESIPNVRTANGVEVCDTDGAAIKIAPAEHLDQVPLDTLLIANPVAANLSSRPPALFVLYGSLVIASDIMVGDGVGDIDSASVVEAVDIVDVRVDLDSEFPP